MTLKNKISFLFSAIFTILYFFASLIVYVAYSDFRKDEFEGRMEVKALSAVKLLIEVNEVDKNLLKTIEENSIDKLLEVKTFVFDQNFKLLYSSVEDSKITWTVDELNYLKNHQSFFERKDKAEVYGRHYKTKERDFYVLVSARDHYGERKLRYLVYLLFVTYVIFTAISLFVTLYMTKRLLHPLDVFLKQIKIINENNLDTRIAVKKNKDEIDMLASEFNEMLQRLDNSYQKQKEFTSQASHELRTPIARITSQIENRVSDLNPTDLNKAFLDKILIDVNKISELISSLLLLSRLENIKLQDTHTHRIDEIIYDSIESTKKIHPEFKISFEIEESENIEQFLEVKGNDSLLKIAFTNLLQNACVYSDKNQAIVVIGEKDSALSISIQNSGAVLTDEEQSRLFEPFMRGNNSKAKSGLGLGLRIVKRILNQHHAQISYYSPDSNTNIFTVIFK